MNKTKAIVLLLFVPLLVFGQKWSTVTGHVIDAEGQVVSGATVILERGGDNFTRQTISGDAGEYSFEGLPSGKYTLQVHKKGFRVQESTFAVQAPASPAPVEVRLEVERLES